MKPNHVLVLLALAATLAAQEPPPRLPNDFFAGRRAALMREVGSGVILLRGAGTPADMAPFYQDQHFYYLSGVSEPNVAMLLFPETGDEVLLVPPFNRFTATWDGERLAPGEAAVRATGFMRVDNSNALPRLLDEALQAGADGKRPTLHTYLAPAPGRTSTGSQAGKAANEMARDPFDGRPTRGQALKAKLQEKYPGLEVQDVSRHLARLRGVKEPAEIDAIRRASEAAAAGIAEAMRSAEPGAYEFQLAAAARYVFSRLGAGEDAYAAIVGAGRNGCVLHYSANSARLADGDLIVMDYAPTVRGYCADVTRTFPANGKFTPEQRKLVQDVYEVQQELVAMVKPGTRISELGARCSALLTKRGYRSAHGPTHHVGLAVHDPGDDVLVPGMVITVEPGAYLLDKNMGCRIEDTILVTDAGHVVLSAGVPATPDAIEKLMAANGLQQVPVGGGR